MKYLKIFKNWRIVTLTVIFIATFILIAGDCNNIRLILFAKLIGLVLGFLGYKTGKEWMEKGLLKELDVFNDNEEQMLS